MDDSIDHEHLKSIVNHVFLPPKLPGEEDNTPFAGTLADMLISAFQGFVSDLGKASVVEQEAVSPMLRAINAVQNFKAVLEATGNISETGLRNILHDVVENGLS